MSRSRDSKTPTLPALPIEIWFETLPFYTWRVVRKEDGYIFTFSFKTATEMEGEVQFSRGRTCKTFRGAEYVEGLLAVSTPLQLVAFMNRYACPIEGIVEDTVGGEWHKTTVEFYWSTFLEIQVKVKDAMRLPIPRLRRDSELKWSFDLKTITVEAELREGVYYGIVTMVPSLAGCYRVIAVERLLANVEYGFCERCGKPFRVSSKHIRKYCDTAMCGHAVAQQKYRDRQRQ